MHRALRLTFHVFLFLFGKHRESANIQLLNITFLLNSVDHNLGIVAIYYWICEPTKVKQYVPLWGLQVIWIVRVFRFRPANIKGDSNNPWCQNNIIRTIEFLELISARRSRALYVSKLSEIWNMCP